MNLRKLLKNKNDHKFIKFQKKKFKKIYYIDNNYQIY